VWDQTGVPGDYSQPNYFDTGLNSNEWTAQYIALRQLREPDAFPAADLVLMRAIAGREGRGHSSSELLDRADAWRPWRAYAAQHLWASA